MGNNPIPACGLFPSSLSTQPPCAGTPTDDLTFHPPTPTPENQSPAPSTGSTGLNYEASNSFIRQLVGRGELERGDFPPLGSQPNQMVSSDQIWSALVSQGFLTASPDTRTAYAALRFGQVSNRADFLRQFNRHVGNRDLTDDEVNRLYDVLSRAYRSADFFIRRLNTFLYPNIQHDQLNTLHQSTIDLLNDPRNSVLRDYARIYLLGGVNRPTDVSVQPIAGEGQTQRDEELSLHSQLLAANLPPRILAAIHSGELRILLRSSRNQQGEIDRFALELQHGFYREVAVLYQDGRITRGEHPSPLTREIVRYLQTLLRGSTANQYTFREEGVFCRETLNALLSFLNARNLMTANFNPTTLRAQLQRRIDEANRTSTAFYATPFPSNFNQVISQIEAYQRNHSNPQPNAAEATNRYEAAREALGNLLQLLEFANQYRDIQLPAEPGNQLRTEQRAFIERCRRLSQVVLPRVNEIMTEIFGAAEGQIGLAEIDRLTLTNYVSKLEKAQREYNANRSNSNLNKLTAARRDLLDNVQQTLSRLRQWQQFARSTPELYNRIQQSIARFRQQLTTQISETEIPRPERTRLLAQINSLDEAVSTAVEAQASPAPAPPTSLRIRTTLANRFSNSLSTLPPSAREVIIMFMRQYLRSHPPSELAHMLGQIRTMSSSYMGQGTIYSLLESMARSSYANGQREPLGLSTNSEAGSDEFMDLIHETEMRDMSDSQRSQVTNLTYNLYVAMRLYNTYADSPQGRTANAQHVSYGTLIRGLVDAMGTLRHPEDGQMPSDADVAAVLENVSRAPTNDELSQQLEQQWGNIAFAGSTLRGSQDVVLSANIWQELERTAVRSGLGALVRGADLARHAGPLLTAQLPTITPANANQLYYVSPNGPTGISITPIDIARVPAAERFVTTFNPLGGTVHTRSVFDPSLVRREPVVAFKLALSLLRLPFSDQTDARVGELWRPGLAAVDIRSILEAFSTREDYAFANNFNLPALSSSALRLAAETLEASNASLAAVIRRTTSATPQTHFSPAERLALINWLASFPLSDPARLEAYIQQHFSTLDVTSRQDLASALGELNNAIPQMRHKTGLSAERQDALRQLGHYLNWADRLNEIGRNTADPRAARARELSTQIAIFDGALSSETPNPALINALREAAGILHETFEPVAFSSVYSQGIATLRHLHSTLVVLASTGSVPEISDDLERVWHTMRQSIHDTISPPSPTAQVAAGLPGEFTYILNLTLYPELRRQLEEVNHRLQTIQQRISQINPDRNPDNHPLTVSVRNFRTVATGFPTLRQRLNNILRREHLGPNDPSLGDNDRLRNRLNSFLGLVERVGTACDSPQQLLANADDLLESALTERRLVQGALESLTSATDETARKKRDVLQALLTTLNQIIGTTSTNPQQRSGLQGLRQTRDENLPVFVEKRQQEIIRDRLLDRLSSDRLDADGYQRLQRHFTQLNPRQRSWFERALDAPVDFAVTALSGTGGDIVGVRGATHLSARAILQRYFASHPNGTLALSDLVVHPGEDSDTADAKIALSSFVQGLPRQMEINLATLLPLIPVLSPHGRGVWSGWRDMPALTSGTHFTTQAGDGGLAQIQRTTNTRLGRLWYSFVQLAAMAGHQNQPQNLSSQLYSLLAQSSREDIRRITSEALGRTDWSQVTTAPLQETNRDAAVGFFNYLETDVLPLLQNPALSAEINRLHRDGHLPLNTTQLIEIVNNPQRRNEILEALPRTGSFQVRDAAHETRPGFSQLAALLQTALRISSERYAMRPLQDPTIDTLAQFDPREALRTATLAGQRPGAPSPTEIRIVHYPTNPQVGALRNAGTLDDIAQLGEDYLNVFRRQPPEIARWWTEDMAQDPTGTLGKAGYRFGSGIAGALVSFQVIMGRQIEAGFADFWSAVNDLASAIRAKEAGEPNADFRITQATRRLIESLTQTVTSFSLFESLPAVFFAELINDIDQGNYAHALGRSVIIGMTVRASISATIDILGVGIQRGWVTVQHQVGTDSFRFQINDPAELAALHEARMAEYEVRYQQVIAQRTGLRLLTMPLRTAGRVVSTVGRVGEYARAGAQMMAYGRNFETQQYLRNLLTEDFGGIGYRLGRLGQPLDYLRGNMAIAVNPSEVQITRVREGQSRAGVESQALRGYREIRLSLGDAMSAPRRYLRGQMLSWTGRLASPGSRSTTLDSGSIRAASEAVGQIFGDQANAQFRFQLDNGTTLTPEELATGLRNGTISGNQVIQFSQGRNVRSLTASQWNEYLQARQVIQRTLEGGNISLTLHEHTPTQQDPTGGQASRVQIPSDVMQRLLEARATGNRRAFASTWREIAREGAAAHVPRPGSPPPTTHGRMVGSWQQWWENFSSLGSAYHTISQEPIPQNDSWRGPDINPIQFTRDAAVGSNWGDRYSIRYRNAEGNMVEAELTGRRMVEIIRTQESGPLADAVRRFFQGGVNSEIMQQRFQQAASRSDWKLFSVRSSQLAGIDYMQTRLNPSALRRLFTTEAGTLPRPTWRNWRDTYLALRDDSFNPALDRYADEQFKNGRTMSRAQARVAMAQQIYSEYTHGRVQTFESTLMGIIERGRATAGSVEARAYQEIESRGLIRRTTLNQLIRAHRAEFTTPLTSTPEATRTILTQGVERIAPSPPQTTPTPPAEPIAPPPSAPPPAATVEPFDARRTTRMTPVRPGARPAPVAPADIPPQNAEALTRLLQEHPQTSAAARGTTNIGQRLATRGIIHLQIDPSVRTAITPQWLESMVTRIGTLPIPPGQQRAILIYQDANGTLTANLPRVPAGTKLSVSTGPNGTNYTFTNAHGQVLGRVNVNNGIFSHEGGFESFDHLSRTLGARQARELVAARDALMTSMREPLTIPPPSTTPGTPLNRQELAAARSILQAMRDNGLEITPQRLQEITTREAFLEEVGRHVGNRLPTYLEQMRTNHPERYNAFLQRVIEPTFRQGLATGAINMGVGLVSALAIGELLNIMGIRGETSRGRAAHFIISMGAGHGATIATSRLATRMVQGRAAELIARSLNTTPFPRALGNFASGLGTSMMLGALYRQVLNNQNVGEHHWLRHPAVEIAGVMVTQTLAQRGISGALTTANRLYLPLLERLGPAWAARLVGVPTQAGGAALGAGLGRLNVVLAGVQLASFASTLAFSNRAISQGERMLEDWRTSLAGGSLGDQILLGALVFVDPFTHGAQTSMAAGMAPEVRADMDRQELQENLPRVISTLQGAWMTGLQTPPEGGRITAAYLRGDDVVSSLGPLAEQLGQRIEFTNQVETGYAQYNVAGVAADGGTASVPIQRIGAREADAYEWLTTGAGRNITNQEQLNNALQHDFGLRDPQEFLTRVTMRNLQDQIGQLVQIEPGTPPNPNHAAIRATFDEHGCLRGNPRDRNTLNVLAGFLAGGDGAVDINARVAALRQATRLQQIIASSPDEEHPIYQPADVTIGLISLDAHGTPHINRENPAYLAVQQARAGAAQELAGLLPQILTTPNGPAPEA